MRIALPRYEPDPNGINDPLILRDRLYAELRSVSEQCQKLAIAPNLAAINAADGAAARRPRRMCRAAAIKLSISLDHSRKK